MEVSHLVDKNNYCTHTIIKEDEFNWKLIEHSSWASSDNEHTDGIIRGCEDSDEIIATFYIKLDGCSHWHFNKDEDGDSYFHLCGIFYYMKFIRGMLFAFKEAVETKENFWQKEIDEFKQYENLLDGFRIVREIV